MAQISKKCLRSILEGEKTTKNSWNSFECIANLPIENIVSEKFRFFQYETKLNLDNKNEFG